MAGAEEDQQGEEGSFTFAVLVWLIIFLAMMGLIIDGSMAISAKQDASNIADAIARAAANDVVVGNLTTTGTVTVNSDPATGSCIQADVDRILNALQGTAGNLPVISDTCIVTGNTVTVTVTVDYHPLLGGTNAVAQAIAIATPVIQPTN